MEQKEQRVGITTPEAGEAWSWLTALPFFAGLVSAESGVALGGLGPGRQVGICGLTVQYRAGCQCQPRAGRWEAESEGSFLYCSHCRGRLLVSPG